MDPIIADLETAKNEHLLINVYQLDTTDFYTGYVRLLGPDAVLIDTYNDAGVQDGSVLLAFHAIHVIEFTSADLDNMHFQIQTAQREHFLTTQQLGQPLHFSERQPLIPQVLRQILVSQCAMMLVLEDSETYLEGTVVKMGSDQFDFDVFDKFNYSDKRVLTADMSAVQIIELNGLELYLETQLMKKQPVHHKTTVVREQEALYPALKDLQAQQQLIAITPRNDEDTFFVGYVNTLNQDSVLLNLIDMGGQFGGYTLTRLNNIKLLTVDSDYLATITSYLHDNQAQHRVVQPVLNAERLFDTSTDLFLSLLQQASAFQQVIRVRLADAVGTDFVGYPSDVTDKQFVFHDITEDLEETDQQIAVNEVAEISFGYMNAYLLEERLKS
ncbi:hypothetical protein IV38_GL000828 [Lactobacillus selangorensis]|uniref:Uncharacterized protein n=1 Tax=Lactobacillus selangorensis TaxID=81857 RepID=A0A0R2FJ36_9LACO|nr:hypothetical protein [Lactobacillus selangorensis]KRN28627.1 hypothetical protein IV38_GL000828 [Lactobacillus selangorensis]KRN32963.1 hypothetical protein IV40_GL001025 [Lactobacillus selangorensis]